MDFKQVIDRNIEQDNSRFAPNKQRKKNRSSKQHMKTEDLKK